MEKQTVIRSLIEYYFIHGCPTAHKLARKMRRDVESVTAELEQLVIVGAIEKQYRNGGFIYAPKTRNIKKFS